MERPALTWDVDTSSDKMDVVTIHNVPDGNAVALWIEAGGRLLLDDTVNGQEHAVPLRGAASEEFQAKYSRKKQSLTVRVPLTLQSKLPIESNRQHKADSAGSNDRSPRIQAWSEEGDITQNVEFVLSDDSSSDSSGCNEKPVSEHAAVDCDGVLPCGTPSQEAASPLREHSAEEVYFDADSDDASVTIDHVDHASLQDLSTVSPVMVEKESDDTAHRGRLTVSAVDAKDANFHGSNTAQTDEAPSSPVGSSSVGELASTTYCPDTAVPSPALASQSTDVLITATPGEVCASVLPVDDEADNDTLLGMHIKFELSKHATQKMEDRTVHLPQASYRLLALPGKAKFSLFAVFDGHCGRQASNIAAKQLVDCLVANLEHTAVCNAQMSDLAVDNHVKSAWAQQDALTAVLPRALHDAFLQVDAEIKQKAKDAGTTATVVVVCGHTVTVATAGDSCAYLDVGSDVILVTGNHRLEENQSERARVTEAGAQLERSKDPQTKRPCGPLRMYPSGLSVSRSLGDRPAGELSSAVPEITQFVLPRQGARLLLASDGLWDSIHPKSACHQTRSCIAGQAAHKLVAAVIKKAGAAADDVSVYVVDFLSSPDIKIPPCLSAVAKVQLDAVHVHRPTTAEPFACRPDLMQQRAAIVDQLEADRAERAQQAVGVPGITPALAMPSPPKMSSMYQELSGLRINADELEALQQETQLRREQAAAVAESTVVPADRPRRPRKDRRSNKADSLPSKTRPVQNISNPNVADHAHSQPTDQTEGVAPLPVEAARPQRERRARRKGRDAPKQQNRASNNAAAEEGVVETQQPSQSVVAQKPRREPRRNADVAVFRGNRRQTAARNTYAVPSENHHGATEAELAARAAMHALGLSADVQRDAQQPSEPVPRNDPQPVPNRGQSTRPARRYPRGQQAPFVKDSDVEKRSIIAHTDAPRPVRRRQPPRDQVERVSSNIPETHAKSDVFVATEKRGSCITAVRRAPAPKAVASAQRQGQRQQQDAVAHPAPQTAAVASVAPGPSSHKVSAPQHVPGFKNPDTQAVAEHAQHVATEPATFNGEGLSEWLHHGDGASRSAGRGRGRGRGYFNRRGRGRRSFVAPHDG